MHRTKTAWIVAASALMHALTISQAQAALPSPPTLVPIGDAMAKVEQWIKDHPKDASGYFVLGRVHALAWVYGEKIPLVWYDRSKMPEFGEYSTIRITREGMTALQVDGHGSPDTTHSERGAVTAADLAHLQASIDAYTKAVALDPTNGLYEEGLAWMMQREGEVGAAMAGDIKDLTDMEKSKFDQAIRQLTAPDFSVREAASMILLDAMPRCAGMLKTVKTDDPEVTTRIVTVFKAYWDMQALSHYRNAYTLALQKDLQNQNPSDFDGVVSADSADQIVAILAEHPSAAKLGEREDLKNTLDKLANKRSVARAPKPT